MNHSRGGRLSQHPLLVSGPHQLEMLQLSPSLPVPAPLLRVPGPNSGLLSVVVWVVLCKDAWLAGELELKSSPHSVCQGMRLAIHPICQEGSAGRTFS